MRVQFFSHVLLEKDDVSMFCWVNEMIPQCFIPLLALKVGRSHFRVYMCFLVFSGIL